MSKTIAKTATRASKKPTRTTDESAVAEVLKLFASVPEDDDEEFGLTVESLLEHVSWNRFDRKVVAHLFDVMMRQGIPDDDEQADLNMTLAMSAHRQHRFMCACCRMKAGAA